MKPPMITPYPPRQCMPVRESMVFVDRWFLIATIGLILIGLLMVASSSIVIAEKQFHHGFHFLTRQSLFLGLSLMIGLMVLRIEVKVWEEYSSILLLISITLLALVLIPGIGHVVNGSRRWVRSGIFRMQVSELAKLLFILY